MIMALVGGEPWHLYQKSPNSTNPRSFSRPSEQMPHPFLALLPLTTFKSKNERLATQMVGIKYLVNKSQHDSNLYSVISVDCSFSEEEDMCGWQNDPNADLQWVLKAENAQKPQSNYFLSLNLDNAQEIVGDRQLRLVSPLIDSVGDPRTCFSFRFGFETNGLGHLKIDLVAFDERSGNNKVFPVWEVEQNQTPGWTNATFPIPKEIVFDDKYLAYRVKKQREWKANLF